MRLDVPAARGEARGNRQDWRLGTAPIVAAIEINRSPDDVFAYLDQLERHGEWQQSIVSTSGVTSDPVEVGTRATDVRRGPGGTKISVTYEIVEHDPPLRTRFKGVNGERLEAGA
jgi:hypothetical protein